MTVAPSAVATPLSPFRQAVASYGERPVVALGCAVTIGYGSLFYTYGVLAPAMAADMGVALDTFFAVFTGALLASAVFAPMAGAWLDKYGARPVLALGSVAAAFSLALCAMAPNIWVLGAGLLFVEFAAALVLYEACFAGLTQIYGHDARIRITAITLIAGFASTLFWPLTTWLQEDFGWRGAILVFAAMHVIIALPLHLFAFPNRKPGNEHTSEAEDGPNASESGAIAILEGRDRFRGMMVFGAGLCVIGLVYSAVPIHMLRIIEASGFTQAQAALIAMVMGPVQVLARILEITFGQRFDPLVTLRLSIIVMVVAVASLIFGQGTLVAALLFAGAWGVGQGLLSIARGTVPLMLFGPKGYGTINGRITGARFVATAFGPLAFAWLTTRFDMGTALWACLALGVLTFAIFAFLKRPLAVVPADLSAAKTS
ncbi:MAG: MFS transporter [Pseudomonadota bacterium]